MAKLIDITKAAPDDWKLTKASAGSFHLIAIVLLSASAAVLSGTNWVEEGGPRRLSHVADLLLQEQATS